MITEMLIQGIPWQALTGVAPTRARATSDTTPTEKVSNQTASPAFRLDISDIGRQKLAESQIGKDASEKDSQNNSQTKLSDSEKSEVQQLKDRDREVRAHEAAHLAAAGSYATGGASYEYQSGPDGKQYAVGGEVGIDVSAEDDPQKTLQKAMQVKAAAMAPAQPSGQDHSVAAQATALAAQAQKELAQKEDTQGTSEGSQDNLKSPNSFDETASQDTEMQSVPASQSTRVQRAYSQSQQSGWTPQSWVA